MQDPPPWLQSTAPGTAGSSDGPRAPAPSHEACRRSSDEPSAVPNRREDRPGSSEPHSCGVRTYNTQHQTSRQQYRWKIRDIEWQNRSHSGGEAMSEQKPYDYGQLTTSNGRPARRSLVCYEATDTHSREKNKHARHRSRPCAPSERSTAVAGV